MKKVLLIAPLLAASLFGNDTTSTADTVKEKLGGKLINTKIDKVIPSTDMNGLYEIYAGQNIIYTNSDAEKLMLGHVFDLTGKDLTQEKIDEIAQKNLKANLDLSKAMKIGSGKHEVIVFTDTECPYCRKAEDLIKDGDMTKYVFFTPLPFHQKAKPQSIHILCSKDPTKEFDKAMKGELDNATLISCDDGEKKLEEMMQIGQKLGVQGTPLFYIDGKKVSGASPSLTGMVK